MSVQPGGRGAGGGQSPTYHDIHITAPGIERTSIFDLPYGISVQCTRVAGWRVWRGDGSLVGGEYDGPDKWVVLDVAGHVIVDSRSSSATSAPPVHAAGKERKQ